MKNHLVNKSLTFTCPDGAFFSLSETAERDQIVVSIQRENHVETARLTLELWDALYQARYELDAALRPALEEVPTPAKVANA